MLSASSAFAVEVMDGVDTTSIRPETDKNLDPSDALKDGVTPEGLSRSAAGQEVYSQGASKVAGQTGARSTTLLDHCSLIPKNGHSAVDSQVDFQAITEKGLSTTSMVAADKTVGSLAALRGTDLATLKVWDAAVRSGNDFQVVNGEVVLLDKAREEMTTGKALTYSQAVELAAKDLMGEKEGKEFNEQCGLAHAQAFAM